MKRLLGVALCMTMLVPTASAATPAQARGVLQSLERQRAAAILQRDIPALRALMDRGYSHIESHGRARSKTELLTALERGAIRFKVYENESLEVQLLDDGDAALVTGIFRSVAVQGSTKTFRGRFVRVWVRKQDGWKNTYHQATEIRPVQSSCPCD